MAEILAEIYSWISFVPKITFKNLIEIAIIAILVYEMLIWIKNTRAWTLLKGIVFILAFFLAAAILELDTILWLLEKTSYIAVTAIIVIFQPELREALGALKDKAARWESGAKAYAELKDRTATIELEAHQRARAIEKEAEEKARRAREAAEQLLCRIRSGYERLRTDVDATITHASGELGRVDKALECVKAEFAEHDAALEQLLLSYQEESGGRKAPEPLPLEES